MGENVVLGPAHQIEFRARWQELEAGFGLFRTAIAFQPLFEHGFQTMQIEHVGSRIFELRSRQCFRCPVR